MEYSAEPETGRLTDSCFVCSPASMCSTAAVCVWSSSYAVMQKGRKCATAQQAFRFKDLHLYPFCIFAFVVIECDAVGGTAVGSPPFWVCFSRLGRLSDVSGRCNDNKSISLDPGFSVFVWGSWNQRQEEMILKTRPFAAHRCVWSVPFHASCFRACKVMLLSIHSHPITPLFWVWGCNKDVCPILKQCKTLSFTSFFYSLYSDFRWHKLKTDLFPKCKIKQNKQKKKKQKNPTIL